MKTCVRCETTKNETEFNKDRKRPDGLYPYCKDCRREYAGAKKRTWRDVTGQRFGRLTAIRRVDQSWVCRCDCGVEKTVLATGLWRQDKSAVKSCGAFQCRWIDNPGYGAMHDRVTRLRGLAREHTCSHCDKPAAHWAYNHSSDDEREAFVSGYNIPYSTDTNDYMPLCVPCHKAFDLGRNKVFESLPI